MMTQDQRIAEIRRFLALNVEFNGEPLVNEYELDLIIEAFKDIEIFNYAKRLVLSETPKLVLHLVLRNQSEPWVLWMISDSNVWNIKLASNE